MDNRLPWIVVILPDDYDDDCDTGYGWGGLANNETDAVAKACRRCDADNNFEEPIDPETVTIVSAEPDFQALAMETYTAWATGTRKDELITFGRLEAALKAVHRL